MRSGALRGARLDGDAQGLGVGARDAAVDATVLAALPGAHLASGAGAELAVDGGAEPGAGQEVLEDADVTTAHPLLERPLPEDALGGYSVCDRQGRGTEGHQGHGERSTA